jgi:exopolysaccharide biosynthesis polyprenyl glycosylphosphotransferase
VVRASGQRERVPAFYRRRRRRGDEIGQVLLRKGYITPEQLRHALALQAESGGQLGVILRELGACDTQAIVEALQEQSRLNRDRKRSPPARLARENPQLLGLQIRCRPGLVVASLIFSDLVALVIAQLPLWVILMGDPLTIPQRLGIATIIPMCMLALALLGLHSVTPLSPPEELRATVAILTLVYLGSYAFTLLARAGSYRWVSHGAWVAGWLVAIVCVPILRGIVRSVLSKRAWWGETAVVFGAGKMGRAVVRTLQNNPQLGLRPLAVLDDDPGKQGTVRLAWGDDDLTIEPTRQDGDGPQSTLAYVSREGDSLAPPSSARAAIEQFAEVEHVPVVGGLELAPVLAQRLRVRSVVIALPGLDSNSMLTVIERFADAYTNVLVIPNLFDLALFGAPTRYMGGMLGLEVHRQLLMRGPRVAKRAMDLLLTSILIAAILPLLAILALLICIDSRGSAFYRQMRVGQDGVRFMALKFRTMHGDGEKRLAEVLARDPELRAEYEEFHKLAVDPRVTRVGRFLRKYSLDELPQLWNVFVGDMSLVGPRPYLAREIPEMKTREAIVLRVKPGITGFWQVSGRNASTFDERVHMDVAYVRGWSPWLDIYIMARTVPVVLGGTGS